MVFGEIMQTLFLLRQVIKGPLVLPYMNKPKETAFAMVMLPLTKETPITAIVSRVCDTIAITLPIMTPCITRNLVFRIVSPWNGGVEEGRMGRGVCRGWEQAQGHQCGPTFSQWFYFSPPCNRAMLIEAIYNGHRLLLLLLPSTTGLRGLASTKNLFLFLSSPAMQHGWWGAGLAEKVSRMLGPSISPILCNNHRGNWAVMMQGRCLIDEVVFYCLLLLHLKAASCYRPNLNYLQLCCCFFPSKCKWTVTKFVLILLFRLVLI